MKNEELNRKKYQKFLWLQLIFTLQVVKKDYQIYNKQWL